MFRRFLVKLRHWSELWKGGVSVDWLWSCCALRENSPGSLSCEGSSVGQQALSETTCPVLALPVCQAHSWKPHRPWTWRALITGLLGFYTKPRPHFLFLFASAVYFLATCQIRSLLCNQLLLEIPFRMIPFMWNAMVVCNILSLPLQQVTLRKGCKAKCTAGWGKT